MKGIVIETDRFFLRSLSVSDVSARYYNWLHSQGKSQYIEYSKRNHTINELKEYVNQRALSDNALLLGIFDVANNSHIGNIKYEPIDFENRVTTMGILIGEKDYRGLGVAPEVIKASSMWLKKTFNIANVILGVSLKNDRAIKAYEKIGFSTYEKNLLNNNLKMHLSV
jgi:[ribosomal protein S5]-alanine N-acetyltransferase